MSEPAQNWKGIFTLSLILVGVVALLGHARFTAAQGGDDKGAPPPAAPALAGRSANAPAGDDEKKEVSGRQAPAAPAAAASGALAPCSATVDEWTTTSTSVQPVAECTVHAPGTGQLLVIANAWMRYDDGRYEAGFTLLPSMTQAPAGAPTVERMVDVYADTGDGADRSVTLSTMWDVFTGTQTISLGGWLEEGIGNTVLADDVTLSVLFIPDSSDLETCRSVQVNGEWSTNSGTYSTIASCSLDAPEGGWLYMIGNGTAEGLSGHPYEAEFALDVDGTEGEFELTRWYNFYDDAYDDGTNGSVTVSGLWPVAPGNHVVNFLGRRWDGVSTVTLGEPTLAAVFIPAGSARAQSCGVASNNNWTTTSSTFESVLSCDVDVPADSWAFISANGTLGFQDGEYEAQVRLGVDDTVGLDWTDRYLNVYSDSGDGMDRPLAVTGIAPVSRGQHTFHFLGARWGGAGRVLVRYPSISVVVPGAEHFIPLVTGP